MFLAQQNLDCGTTFHSLSMMALKSVTRSTLVLRSLIFVLVLRSLNTLVSELPCHFANRYFGAGFQLCYMHQKPVDWCRQYKTHQLNNVTSILDSVCALKEEPLI